MNDQTKPSARFRAFLLPTAGAVLGAMAVLALGPDRDAGRGQEAARGPEGPRVVWRVPEMPDRDPELDQRLRALEDAESWRRIKGSLGLQDRR